jgi:UDP-GlcNAc:undecaprenyl-phosphate GlcNAc-1-phosphate transferase
MLISLYASLTAFVLCYLAIPQIIVVAKQRRIFDPPNPRSSHSRHISSLGGIGIVTAASAGMVLWIPSEEFHKLKFIIAASTLLFVVGLRDDLLPMSAIKKIFAQFLAAGILVFFAGIQIDSLHGLFGMHQALDKALSIPVSLMLIIGIINAFNFLDGIDGLVGFIGTLISVCLGAWFVGIGDNTFAIIAFCTAGALLAFLIFNISPAKIFMGDTGALQVGLSVAVLIIHFIRTNDTLAADDPLRFHAVPAVALALLIIPIFDMVRVLAVRLFRGISPFHPDRRHIHHIVVDLGLSHLQATLVLFTAQCILMLLAYLLHKTMELHLLISLQIGFMALFTYALHAAMATRRRPVRPRSRKHVLRQEIAHEVSTLSGTQW